MSSKVYGAKLSLDPGNGHPIEIQVVGSELLIEVDHDEAYVMSWLPRAEAEKLCVFLKEWLSK